MSKLLNYRRALIVASQLCLFVVSYYCSFLLRFDFNPSPAYQHLFAWTLPIVLVVEVLVFSVFGLVRGWWRYVGMSDALDIGSWNQPARQERG